MPDAKASLIIYRFMLQFHHERSSRCELIWAFGGNADRHYQHLK